MRVPGGLSVHSSCVPTVHQELFIESDSAIGCMYTTVSF